ncbi:MarR family winged helix-turn-helix transcriptional regulator [Demequina lignilytica]|uniref:MarR family transcriptional regulator n=1 Tax=Demequina lignilytica TaxID=3051663 RepID=A0AB35MHC2_9MICO|nr:MarR family transcriptional regulator [Demequina sp. SYSU T0a273]MDN4483137.1 MarR family transcriptional regulator [Demequina sp. SYSU T0a273]
MIVELVAQTQRLTRLAAQATGNSTPASSWRLLSILDREGPQRIGTLAAAVRVSQPALTQIAQQLTEQGLVVKEPDPDDARAAILTLTDEGRVAIADWRAELGGALSPYFSGLDADAWEHLAATVEILTALDKESL